MKRTVLLLLLTLPALWGLQLRAQQTTHLFEVAKNLDIFNALYRDLDLYYVDTLDAKKNIGNALLYMLNQIDPYTEYYAEDQTDDLRQLSTGQYAGIGAIVGYREASDRCVIIKPYQDMPAARAGLRPGDVILALDGKAVSPCGSSDEDARTKYSNDISGRLRGEPGTTLEIKVLRAGTNKTYTFQVTRSKITMPSVGLATMAADSIGYISLTQFIEGTSAEVRRAMVDLKQKGARSLLLDLRGNPGGVMEEAVKTVNLFLPRGREVVITRGKVKEMNQTYKTTVDPQDPDIPLIILVNGESASASEITAGALQDYDRALIMGQRTYGKGLVQQSRELPYKSYLKLTAGKYYIPSGRCVQAYSFKDGRPVHLADSLAKEFRTAAGRIVKDGGGISPDVVLPTDSLPNLIAYLAASDQLFDYCVDYRLRHPDGIASAGDFRLTDEEYAAFTAFMKEHGFTYDRQSEKALAALKRIARFEGYDADAAEAFKALEQKLHHNESSDFQRWEKEIRRVVEASIVEHYYYDAGREAYLLRDDADVKAAVEMMHNHRLMYKILTGEPDA